MLRNFLCCAVLVLVGCGASDRSESSMYGEMPQEYSLEAIDSDALLIDQDGDGLVRFHTVTPPNMPGGEAATVPVTAEAPPATAGRKIVYTGNVRMVVKDINEFLTALKELIVEQGGFIGSSTESGMDGANPSASITVRVPSAGYQPILGALDTLGTVEERSETSRDVTAEFVDIEARIRNKEREEQRLLELLGEAEGKLKEILEVERELSRVRGEIERAQGQMNVLKDQVDLATITIRASERTVYTPPMQAAFGDRVGAAWGNSLSNLGDFISQATIEVVAFVPWLVIWGPLAVITWFLGSRMWRKTKAFVVGTIHLMPIGRTEAKA